MMDFQETKREMTAGDLIKELEASSRQKHSVPSNTRLAAAPPPCPESFS
jgi:hypothetical protein